MTGWPGCDGPARARPPRGQPIVALLLLLGGWVAVRATLLGAGYPGVAPDLVAEEDLAPAHSPTPRHKTAVQAAEAFARTPMAGLAAPPRPVPVPVREPLPVGSSGSELPRIAGGHQLLWLAGLAMVPLPPEATPALVRGPAPRRERKVEGQPSSASPALQRWSVDGWVMWRQGGNGYNLPGAGLRGADLPSGTYGASQAGLVVRYRLAPASPLRPTLFLRATSALRAPRGEELAAGLSLRPVKRVPVVATAELRATRAVDGRIVARPAAGVVSEFAPLPLPLGVRAETYVAAGYVAGRAGTPFIDGQTRLERPMTRLGPVDLRLGGGAWGGAQRGAQRLDVGPAATLALPLGAGGARLRAEWRFRVVGKAAPASGPALTLSAGF